MTEERTGCLATADGTVYWGVGFGAAGAASGELCFNTAVTGYQEVMTDPSYDQQIVTFTFPHIGNVGANREDEEGAAPKAIGMVTRWAPTAPSNWRSQETLPGWMERTGRIGVGGLDTRRITRRIRDEGMPHAALAHDPAGAIDPDALIAAARAFQALEGRDLAEGVGVRDGYAWRGEAWRWPDGFAPGPETAPAGRRVVAIDFGAKLNILRELASAGCEVLVAPPTISAEALLALKPDGVFLSNGPGDPAATARYAAPTIKAALAADLPIFGICLGHQLLALALGARTVKMGFGHHGVNHPVKELATGRVSVTSMNHGFAVDADTLPEGVRATHVSLFDGSNCGLAVEGRPVFSVQHHPEASPGPQDSLPLFKRFVAAIEARARAA
ncbi:MAG: glutamine-hydrolyzing carbamoyl-phosphate synthase small subunit [Pseudomonadota bacterium]